LVQLPTAPKRRFGDRLRRGPASCVWITQSRPTAMIPLWSAAVNFDIAEHDFGWTVPEMINNSICFWSFEVECGANRLRGPVATQPKVRFSLHRLLGACIGCWGLLADFRKADMEGSLGLYCGRIRRQRLARRTPGRRSCRAGLPRRSRHRLPLFFGCLVEVLSLSRRLGRFSLSGLHNRQIASGEM
jgi:hypothetical protein